MTDCNCNNLVWDDNCMLQVSLLVRRELIERARDFNIILDDVSITELSFGKEYTAAVEAKQVGTKIQHHHDNPYVKSLPRPSESDFSQRFLYTLFSHVASFSEVLEPLLFHVSVADIDVSIVLHSDMVPHP